MSVQELLSRLDKVRQTQADTWRCQCPCDHTSPSQMKIKELPDGRILIHCFAGHSPSEIMERIDLKLSDLFEDAIEDRIVPLYLARKEKKQQDAVQQTRNHWQLILDMAKDMRSNGANLSSSELAEERNAFMQLRAL